MVPYLRNLLRPWKVVTFVLGTSFFIWGAYFYAVPTWDVWNSILMSVLCYLLAPFAVTTGLRALRDRQGLFWLELLGAGALVYLVGSGSYELYHLAKNGSHPVTYWENLFFSVPVTIIAGYVWQYDGSLRDFARELKSATNRANSRD